GRQRRCGHGRAHERRAVDRGRPRAVLLRGQRAALPPGRDGGAPLGRHRHGHAERHGAPLCERGRLRGRRGPPDRERLLPVLPADGVTAPRDLRLLAGAVLLSALGDFVALIALVLRVHELTGSGFAVAALFATTMAPMVALAPVAGLLADRVESVRLLAIVS